MITNKIRVVLDSNIIGSILLGGDPDLLKIRKYANTQIISMKEFIEIYS